MMNTTFTFKTFLFFTFLFQVSVLFAQTTRDTSALDAYKKAFETGNRSPVFLKNYLMKFDSLEQPVDQDILDEYVNTLQVRDLDNFETVAFLFQCGPVLEGKTYKLINLNQTIVDSIYHKLPLSIRVKMNDKIIENTFAQAVARKDANLASRLSYFMRHTWLSSNPFNGEISEQKTMLRYYKAVKDTANFLNRSIYFYDNYYVRMSPDSMARISFAAAQGKKNYRFGLDSAERKKWEARPKNSTVKFVNHFAQELNNAAYDFYEWKVQGPNLYRALEWSKRAIAFNADEPAYYDTLAHILYALEFYSEAEQKQKYAVDLAKKQQKKTDKLLLELEKIKDRKR